MGKIFLGKVNSLMRLLLLMIGMVGGVPMKIDLNDLRSVGSVHGRVLGKGI